MQTKDLVVGADYAVTPYKWSDPERATIVETKSHSPRQGYRKADVYGPKVRLTESGTEVVVRPQMVVQEWDAYVAEQAESARVQAEHAQQRHEHKTKRAAQIFALSERLLSLGYSEHHSEGETGYCYNNETVTYLKAAGFVSVTTEDGYYDRDTHFRSAFYDLDDVMSKGKIPLDAALLLAGLAGPTEGD